MRRFPTSRTAESREGLLMRLRPGGARSAGEVIEAQPRTQDLDESAIPPLDGRGGSVAVVIVMPAAADSSSQLRDFALGTTEVYCSPSQITNDPHLAGQDIPQRDDIRDS